MVRYRCTACHQYETNKTSNFKRHLSRCLSPEDLAAGVKAVAEKMQIGCCEARPMDNERHELVDRSSSEVTAHKASTGVAKNSPTMKSGRRRVARANSTTRLEARLAVSEQLARDLQDRVNRLESMLAQLRTHELRSASIRGPLEYTQLANWATHLQDT